MEQHTQHLAHPHTGHQQPHPTKPKKEGIKSILATVGLLLLAPVIAILLTAFVFQSYEVDGPSMETTLQNKDRLIVYKLPKTWARVTGHAYEPNRGDIIIFTRKGTLDYGNIEGKQLIKRVIGVPGDRVIIKEGSVTVYNDEHPEGFNPDEGVDHGMDVGMTSGNVDITVKDKEVFVLGDNRANSLDSRAFGTIQDKHIIGKLVLRIYPFNKFDAF